MTEDNPKILDKFAVLHIDECGDVVEKPSEVTASSHSSPRAVLMKMGFPVKIKCNVLMYYKPNTHFLKLHVYVIPLDPALQQMVDKKESSSGYEKIIKKPRPDKSLQMQQSFTLTADIDTATIHPKKITLRYNNQDPNFYEVYIKNPDREFNMTLHPYSKKSEAVWTCKIQKGDHPSSGPVEEKHSVDEQLSAQLHKAATISSDRERIQKMMEHLTESELKEFKWTLEDQNFILMLDLPNIPISELDKADMLDLVDLMIQAYSQRSVEVTKKVFKKMNRNDLVLMLSEIISGQKEKHSVDEAAAASRQEEPMTSMIEELQETLKDLNNAEFNNFKWILQKTIRQRDLPRILSSRMERADRADVVELMVEMYSEQSVDVMREVFKKMNRNDLVQKLPEISSASEGDSTNLELEGCESVVQDSSVWTKLEPEVNSADTDEAPTYSLQSEAGQFECSVSRLRWVCEENASFKYQFHSWGGYMERMESRQYMPAGALINISIIAGKLTEVHLPHWICIEDNPEILDKFAVLHIDECGDVVEKPSEVTASHVKLTQPNFSLRGVLIKLGFPVKTECNVLLYYKTNTSFLKLRVFVIPLDPAVQQTVDKKESSRGYEEITKPRPDKHLKMKQRFSLTAYIDTATITEKEITLKYPKQYPNFSEVYIKNPDREFIMTLHPYSKKNEAVWSCAIRKDDHPSSGPVEAADSSTGSCSYAAVGAAGSSSGSTGVNAVADGKHFVDKHRGELIKRVSNIEPILDDLLEEEVITQEAYTDIRVIATHQKQMRALYEGPLKAGKKSMDTFYQILQKHEKYLIEDLQGKK